MATIEIKYLGDLRVESTHVQSGQKLLTDAPLDNKGKGEAFSPTDLLATALATCMVTVMGIAAREHHIDMEGITCSVIKIMASDPRRVSQVHVSFGFPNGQKYTEKEKVILERSARTCPVAKSVHPELIQDIVFNFV